VENVKTTVNSTVLRDYPFEDQLELIEAGRDYLKDTLKVTPKVFVAGRWSENNDTIKALVRAGFTHDCSPPAGNKASHFDWSKLPRICMPYHPSERDYQKKGKVSLLILPISQFFPKGNVNPEVAHLVGLPWFKACFTEYYSQNLPLFHICLHSPCMTDPYFLSIMDEFFKFICKHKNVNFRFASEIRDCDYLFPKTKITPYIFAINQNMVNTLIRSRMKRLRAIVGRF
jgi:hypothetical protein